MLNSSQKKSIWYKRKSIYFITKIFFNLWIKKQINLIKKIPMDLKFPKISTGLKILIQEILCI